MKAFLAVQFMLEAACLAAIIVQVLNGCDDFVRTVMSLLLLAAFAKTEYDWLQLSKSRERVE